MKNIQFFSGFPRAGNTLFSCVLNQNPDISATAKSILTDVYFQIENCRNFSIYKNFPDTKSFDNVLKNVHQSYYKDFKEKYIVERGEWITPFNYLSLKKYFNQDIRIVILVRDIIDIIKSHIKLCNENPDFYFNTDYNEIDKSMLYKSEIEDKCDLIMAKDSYMELILMSVNWIIKNASKETYLFVDYDDLIKNPKDTFKKVYKFYDIPYFEHDFEKIDELKINDVTYDDTVFNAPMHKVRSKLKKDNYDIELPKRVIEKYSGYEIWKTLD